MYKSLLIPLIFSLQGSTVYAKLKVRHVKLKQFASKPVFHEEKDSLSSLLTMRGGKQVSPTKKKKRKKKKSKKSKSPVEKESIEPGKNVIKDALKEDAAAAMGDAIRARASDLLEDDLTHPIHHDDMTLNSISYAIGSSEQHQRKQPQRNNGSRSRGSSEYHDGGGVEPNSSAVIANYFLKSHGGLHGIQSIMSFLSVLFGLGTFVVPSSHLNLKMRLMQRSLICALSKHLSGFVAAASASASKIPDIGWRKTRMRVESFALDPVAQYLFYCALILLWSSGIASSLTIPSKTSGITAAVATTAAIPWWLKDTRNVYCILCLIGPILLREVISTIWVIADVLVLHHTSNVESNPSLFLKTGKSTIDATMSLLLTPSQWRGADAALRQKLLAKLVARISLGFEIGTGLILIIDALRAFLDFSVSSMSARPSLISVAKRLICARLYINFMLVRRRKVIDLVKNLRGGFMHVPGRVLDTLLAPQKAMGLDWDVEDTNDEHNKKNFVEWIGFMLGF